MKSLIYASGVSLVLSLLLSACGGGGGSSSDSTLPSSSSTVNTGTFIDSPVQGLEYFTATLSGYTDNKGQFQYRPGETVSFLLGNLKLGSATGQSIITPLTLVGDTDLNSIGLQATGIGKLLQTLDNNSSNGALLVIPSLLRDLDIAGLNLSSDADLNTILARAEIKTGINYILKDAASVQAEMKNSINAYTSYPLINTFQYSASGTKYYLLSLLDESNVHTTHFGRKSFKTGMVLGGTNLISIYDLGLNSVTKHDGKLYAGTYIIKVQHDVVENSVFLINYPMLTNQSAHTNIQNGTYSGTGYKYYSLHMPSNGLISFTYDAGLAGNTYPAYIYDENLSLVSHMNSSVKLNTGNYVILFDHGATDSSGKSFTVESSILN